MTRQTLQRVGQCVLGIVALHPVERIVEVIVSRLVGQLPAVLLPDEIALLQRQERERRVGIVAARDLDVPRTGRLVRAPPLDQLDELTECRLDPNIGELERDVEALADQGGHADGEHGVTAEPQETGVVETSAGCRSSSSAQISVRTRRMSSVPGTAGTLSNWAVICRVSPRGS